MQLITPKTNIEHQTPWVYPLAPWCLLLPLDASVDAEEKAKTALALKKNDSTVASPTGEEVVLDRWESVARE